MKAHEITVESAMAITGFDINGVQSMLERGVLHRVEKGEVFIQRASLLDCLAQDRVAREAVEKALAPAQFWVDLEEDLKDPEFVEAYIEAFDLIRKTSLTS